MNPEILDLSNFDDQSIDFSVTREAGFDNTVDFYQVDADGGVVDPDTGNTIAPGEDGYTEVAVANRLGADISTANGVTSEFTVDFSGGASYAPLLSVDSDFSAFADGDASNDPTLYFTYEAANVDGFDHVIGTDGSQLTFEDLPNGGDEDFNDIILNFGLDAGTPTDDTGEPIIEGEGDGSISGLKFDDLNGNSTRDSETGLIEELVQGDDPDVVFVIDTSGSTNNNNTIFEGNIDIEDLNGDGRASDTIDAEIFAFSALNQQLINSGLGNIDISVVEFSNTARQLITTTPEADDDGNGTPDIVDNLTMLRSRTGTNFNNALEGAEEVFLDLGTEPGNGNLIFISDGDSGANSETPEIANRLRDDLGINITAFGAGTNSDLDVISQVDPGAIQFTTTDQLVDIFGNLDGNGNASGNSNGEANNNGSQGTIEPTISDVTIYLDLNNNGELDTDEPSQVTDENGEYSFTGLEAGTYFVREVVPNGFTQTAPAVAEVTLGEGESIEDLDFGNTASGEPVVDEPIEEPVGETPTDEPVVDQPVLNGSDIQLQFVDRGVGGSEFASQSVTATVGEGVEFANIPSIVDSVPFDISVDISPQADGNASIVFEGVGLDSGFSPVDPGAFFGYRFTDISDELPAIENVSIGGSSTGLILDSGSGFDASDLSFTENTIDVNLENINFSAGETLSFNVEFA